MLLNNVTPIYLIKTNYSDNKKVSVSKGCEEGSEITMYDVIIVDTCLRTFFQYHRMYKNKNEA